MKALKREDDAVTYAAIEFLNALMQVSPVIHSAFIKFKIPYNQITNHSLSLFLKAYAQRLRLEAGTIEQEFAHVLQEVPRRSFGNIQSARGKCSALNLIVFISKLSL